MEPKTTEVDLGTIICKNLKEIYFSEKKWPECYMQIAQKFTKLKRIMRKFYSDDKEIDVLRRLRSFSEADIEEASNVMEGGQCKGDQPGAT